MEEYSDMTYKVTYIAAVIYTGLPNMVPNKSWDIARRPNDEYTTNLICILTNI